MHEVSVPRYEQCMPLINPIQVHDLNPTSFQHASSPGNEDSALKSCSFDIVVCSVSHSLLGNTEEIS
jgi:hypothetical protein